MRRVAILTGIAFGVALACGCRAAGRPHTLAWLDGGRAAADAPSQQNPFRRELARRSPESGDPRFETTGYAPADEQPLSGTSPGRLDPATQALVDRELQDATPEERRQLLAEFQSIDPSMVRQLLRIRRMVRQSGHQAPADTSEPAAIAPAVGYSQDTAGTALQPAAIADASSTGLPTRETVTPGAGSGPTGLGISRPGPETRATNGLGGVDPWNQPPGVGRTASPSYSAESDAPRSRGLGRMVPRLDGLPNIFPGNQPAAGAALPPLNAEPPPPTGRTAPPSFAVVDAPPGAVWQRDLEHLIARLESEVSHLHPSPDPDDPVTEDYVEAHVYLRLLYLIAGRQEQAIAHIPGVDPAVQQFWQQTLWSLANYFDFENMPDPAERVSQTLWQLHAAATHLRERAPLKLANVAFCTKITSFGNYDRFNPYEFSPGQPVLLYAEVENFRSEPTTDAQGQNAFRTVLKSKIEILSPSGEVRYQMELPSTEDLCRTWRRDYFHSYEFTIPPRMPYGHHVLVLSVEDRVSQKVATYRLNFTVK